jgi:RNA polymerase sigma factor (sigma-70 family)
VNLKKLNLDEIQEEVLDECFGGEKKTLEELISSDDEELDDDPVQDTPSDQGLTIDKIKQSVRSDQFISNEVLVRNVQQGIDVEKSKELLIMYNSGLVYTEAKNCTCNIPFQDKVQYGFEALMKAIYGFNTNFRTQFSTYATTAIRQHMYRNGNNDVRMVALPEHLSMNNIRIQAFIEAFMNDKASSGYPTNEQIAEGTGIDIRSVKRIMNYNSNLISMDATLNSHSGDEGSQHSLKDVITSDGDDYNLDERCVSPDFLSVMDTVLDELQEHDRVIIGLVHGIDGYRVHTFDEIISSGYIDGNGKYVTSKATLSRRYNEALDKVRRVIERKQINFD